MASNREFDLVVFGATGFTGFFMVRELVQSIDQNMAQYGSLKWAVAGRNLSKVDEMLAKLGTELGKDMSKTPKIHADVTIPETLLSMAQRTKLVVNVVGPYKMFGKPVVEACVRSGTHHIDISGEPAYIERTQCEFDSMAQENGSLVISTCGFDSIPNDLGVDYMKKNFDGKLHSVESFVRFLPGAKGYSLNFGTFQSAIYFIADFFEYLKIHTRLYKQVLTKKIPKSRIRQPMRLFPFTRKELPGWNIPFLGPDRPTVERTQYHNFQYLNERPVQFTPYLNVNSFVNVLRILLFCAIIGPMSMLRVGRYLLEKYPEKFTRGHFTKQGPTRDQVDTTSFTMTLFGKGWSKEVVDSTDPQVEPTRPMDKAMTVLVSGRDPAYVATSTAMIQAGLTILKEREKMPKGGVMTPASAFRDTKLVERLQSRELKFEIMEK